MIQFSSFHPHIKATCNAILYEISDIIMIMASFNHVLNQRHLIQQHQRQGPGLPILQLPELDLSRTSSVKNLQQGTGRGLTISLVRLDDEAGQVQQLFGMWIGHGSNEQRYGQRLGASGFSKNENRCASQ